MAITETGQGFLDMADMSGAEKRSGGDRRSGIERRTLVIDFDGPDRRVGDRRDGTDRRQRRASRRRRG